MFKRLVAAEGATVTINLDGKTVEANEGDTVAAAALVAGYIPTRTSPVSGAPRAPFCMMGACFECLMEIDGIPNQQACMTVVRDGMSVRRQEGAGELSPE